TFFHEVRIWLDKVEAEVYLHPPGKGGERTRFEHQILQRVEKAVLPPLAHLFQRFETAAAKVEKELRPHHASYAKYALHPAVLCAPFMYRTFQKPLGYAGDYEMVNMMVLNPYQGDSIFAKILNAFFLRTPPVAAHRNRIDYLAGMLESEAYRLSKRKKPIRVLNLGCGPAAEIQRFLGYSFLSHKASLTLLDFEDEAIRFTKRALKYVKEQSGRDCEIHVIKKSVTQFLKETPGPFSQFKEGHYDVVYCAGLFDYLSDDICSRLLDIFYGLTAPEGLMLVSNVDSSNPSRGWMELVVDWHLVYRNSLELARLFPPSVPKDSIHITAEPTSVNVFAEVRKPQHA
ncbi:MAG: class I SAM-dependent methyltransferase, partial [Verrucomicrobia bacterium]|nr:class I SAM-dependent methyltransferase [Verrucomicrobiota bacterium]